MVEVKEAEESGAGEGGTVGSRGVRGHFYLRWEARVKKLLLFCPPPPFKTNKSVLNPRGVTADSGGP